MPGKKIVLSEFQTYLTDLVEKEVQNKLETADKIMTKRALQLKGKISALSPRDTGAYAGGWRVKTVQRDHEKVRLVYNETRPELTYILEFGSSHQRAQPHIRPAIEQVMDEMIEELINQL